MSNTYIYINVNTGNRSNSLKMIKSFKMKIFVVFKIEEVIFVVVKKHIHLFVIMFKHIYRTSNYKYK